MSTDGQGRPLSDDGQWAWNGVEWVPAAIGGAVPPPAAADPNVTVIAPSPFARGPAAPVSQSSYPEPGYSAATPNFGSTPGYGAGQPQNAIPGAPPTGTRSSKNRLIAIAAVVIIVAVAIVLIVTLTGGKKSSGLAGAYTCKVPGTAQTGVLTFNPGEKYALSENGKSGTYTLKGDTVTFIGGSLNKAVGSYDRSAKTVKITFLGATLTCNQ